MSERYGKASASDIEDNLEIKDCKHYKINKEVDQCLHFVGEIEKKWA